MIHLQSPQTMKSQNYRLKCASLYKLNTGLEKVQQTTTHCPGSVVAQEFQCLGKEEKEDQRQSLRSWTSRHENTILSSGIAMSGHHKINLAS